jgi:hypothetical protein
MDTSSELKKKLKRDFSSLKKIKDISSIQNHPGKNNFFQTSVCINTEMVLSISVIPEVASMCHTGFGQPKWSKIIIFSSGSSHPVPLYAECERVCK